MTIVKFEPISNLTKRRQQLTFLKYNNLLMKSNTANSNIGHVSEYNNN